MRRHLRIPDERSLERSLVISPVCRRAKRRYQPIHRGGDQPPGGSACERGAIRNGEKALLLAVQRALDGKPAALLSRREQ